MLLMQCVCLIGPICRPPFRHRCIIPHYSLTHSLAASLPSSLYFSLLLSLSLSIPPSLAGLYLLARLRGNYHSSETLSNCTATLRSALPPSTHTAHTYGHTQTYRHILWTCTHTHEHSCTQKTPSHTHKDYTLSPSPPLALPLHQTLLRLILLTIVLPP